ILILLLPMNDPTFSIAKEIRTMSHPFSTLGVIDHKLGEFLINIHPICPVLYTLPKMHKNLISPPGRPIVASTGSLLSPLARVLEKILSPFMCHIPSFLRDTSHFLTCIRDLRTMSSLFNAMGSNVTPPYANIFMAEFESTFVYTHPLFQQYCLLWKRYIDDIFLIWKGDIESLMSFYHTTNQRFVKLTFTIQHDQRSIPFLDTLVVINDDRVLSTDLYVKPTDKNCLLFFTSCHPRHIKRSLPKLQFQRINRIVSDPSQRTLRLNDMASKFHDRGYPDTLLDCSMDTSSSNTSRSDIRRIAFVNTYHPFMQLFNKIIHRHWPSLGLSYPDIPEFLHFKNLTCTSKHRLSVLRLTEFLVPPLMCHKKPPSLRNLLVSADIGSSKTEMRQTVLTSARKGTFPCLHCLQCSNITRGDTFTHPRSGKQFPIHSFYSCDSTYVIYFIKCPCSLGYVGGTTQHIQDRISQHKSTIRCKRVMLPIPAHFVAHNNNISQLRYQIIDSIPMARRGGNRTLKLKEKEAYWIHTLQTLEPNGLNREYEIFY
ncbi:unnamed protein product, partial [Ranitomeya imitator]